MTFWNGFEDSAEFTNQLNKIGKDLEDPCMLSWLEDTEFNWPTQASGLVEKYKNIVKQYNEVVSLLESLDD